MKVEDNDDVLARCDAFEPFQVLLLDGQRPLHIGDSPVPGDLFGVRAHEADRLQFDANTEVPLIRISV